MFYNNIMEIFEYSDEDLIRVDTDSKKHFPKESISFKSTLKIKKNVNYARKIRNRENEILSFQLRLDELKESILFIVTDDIFLWNIPSESILIENVEYNSIDSFINSVIHELKMVVTNLRAYDSHQAESFKTDLINEIPVNSKILELVNNI